MGMAWVRWATAFLLWQLLITVMAEPVHNGKDLEDAAPQRALLQDVLYTGGDGGIQEGDVGDFIVVPTAPTTAPAPTKAPPPAVNGAAPHAAPDHTPAPKPPRTDCNGCSECPAGGKCDLCAPCKPCQKCIGHDYDGCEDCNTCGSCDICFTDCLSSGRCGINSCMGSQGFEGVDHWNSDVVAGVQVRFYDEDTNPSFGAAWTIIALASIAVAVVGAVLKRRSVRASAASAAEKECLVETAEMAPSTAAGRVYGATSDL